MDISVVLKELDASKSTELACSAFTFIFDVVLNPVAV